MKYDKSVYIQFDPQKFSKSGETHKNNFAAYVSTLLQYAYDHIIKFPGSHCSVPFDLFDTTKVKVQVGFQFVMDKNF